MRFVIITFFFISCEFSSAVQKDTQKRILSHKVFMKSLYYNGVIKKKIYCKECNYNMYQIIIDLIEISPNIIKLSDESFQPYYFFISDKQLNISLTNDAFNFAKENMSVNKRSNCDSLLMGNRAFLIISKEKYEWIP